MDRRQLIFGISVFFLTWLMALWRNSAMCLWPVIVALVFVVITRRALWGLLVGAYAGALLLCNGNPWQAYLTLFSQHLSPSLTSTWKIGAILFTLILGGFAAVLNANGGFQAILYLLVRGGKNASQRFQLAAASLGLLCFFDGLANSMMVGRVCEDVAEKCGVSRVKLAYIADSTSSAVACVAFVSTWIAYQLTMIKEGYQQAGMDINPYLVFVKSIPYNFYCWFTLVLLFVSILQKFNPGSMKTFEDEALLQNTAVKLKRDVSTANEVKMYSAYIPLIALILSFFFGFYFLGCPPPKWPVTADKITTAFGSDTGPLVLVLSGFLSSVVAIGLFPSRPEGRFCSGILAFKDGVQSLVGPVFILIAAWMIGSVLGALETAEYLSRLVSKTNFSSFMPALIFVTAALISFSTGTSWGTMGILFPLAIPIAAAASQGFETEFKEAYLQMSVAAVFSGAVFGDHCSPFSDTTIVSSIACGVEPHDHIRTQIPFALLTAAVTILFGFLPVGLRFSPFLCLLTGTLLLYLIPKVKTIARPNYFISNQ